MTSPRTAALLVAASALLFAGMAVLVKHVTTRLPGPEIAFVRFGVGLAACALATTRYRLRARNWTGLFWRGAFGGSAVLCYFLAIEHLPVGVATLLNYTAPVFTATWAALFLGEPIGLRAAGALALTLLGVAGVVTGNAPTGFSGIGIWELVGILSALLSGAAVATIREVRKTDGSWEIFAAFSLVGALVTGAPALRGWVTPTVREWLILVTIGLVSVVAQILMTYALRFLRAALAGVLMQLTPVAALTFGYLLYGDRIAPVAFGGALVTLLGVSWGVRLASASQAAPAGGYSAR
jgi:drug/metabolite transporter (DMT)-like permease